MNGINVLNRCQLLSLFKRLDSLRNNLDKDEEAKKQVVIMITLVQGGIKYFPSWQRVVFIKNFG